MTMTATAETQTAVKIQEGAQRFQYAFTIDPDELVIIGLDTADKEGEHALWDRRAFLPVNEPLVKYMVKKGFPFGAIEVTRVAGKFVVVDGRQRVKAAREANNRLEKDGVTKIRVRCMVEKGSQEDLFDIMIAANHFQTLIDPLSRAELIATYKQRFNRSNKDAGLQFGLSGERIRQTLKLLNLRDEIKEAIRAGKISANKAEGLADLDEDEQLEVYREAIEGGKSAEEIKAKARSKAGKSAAVRPGIREIRAVLENEKLTPTAAHALRWVLGEEDSAQPDR